MSFRGWGHVRNDTEDKKVARAFLPGPTLENTALFNELKSF
jgi:hypothetical protein